MLSSAGLSDALTIDHVGYHVVRLNTGCFVETGRRSQSHAVDHTLIAQQVQLVAHSEAVCGKLLQALLLNTSADLTLFATSRPQACRGAVLFNFRCLYCSCFRTKVSLACVLHRFFYLASIPLLVAAVVYGLRYMPSRRSSWAVKLDVGLAWFSALSVLVLVPTDVASTLQVSSHVLLFVAVYGAVVTAFASIIDA